MRGRRGAWISTAIYAAVIWLFFVRPLHGRFGTAMLGTALFPHDAILAAGILEWCRRAIASPALHVFDWTAGYPLTNTLANVENLLGWQPLYALLRALGATVTFSYNTLIVGSFLLSAAGARLLARRLGANEEGACLAGVVFAFVPFHLAHVIHLQTMAVCWAPIAFLCLDRYLVEGRALDLAGTAASAVLCFLSGLYIGLFLAIALPLYAGAILLASRAPLDRRRLAALAGAGLASAAALWPVVDHYLRWAHAFGYSHPIGVMTRFSIELLALAKVPFWLAVWSGSGYPGITTHESAAFPGIVATVLVILAFRGGDRDKGVTRALLFLAATFFALSLGPRLLWRENTPVPHTAWLPLPGQLLGLVSAVRWSMRALLLTFLFGAVLAGLGFTQVTRRLSPRWRQAAAVAAGLLMLIEYRPIDYYAGNSHDVPDPMALSDAYPVLAAEADRGAIVELPVADAGGYRTPMLVRSTYGSAGHLRRVVAIHGQTVPPLTAALLEDAERLPDPAAAEHLRKIGCTRVVMHRTWMRGRHIDDMIARMRQAGMPVMWESLETVIFSLTEPPSPAR
ncbi:MAG TPA: hypothetical protein VL309_01310 [Vicinamibacterales bacterium]|nr:hypothetical protein [Vicinamibacterales bacterium]